MYGAPSSEAIKAFKRDVSREVNAAVERVAAQHGIAGQVLLIDGQGSEEGDLALERLEAIRAIVKD